MPHQAPLRASPGPHVFVDDLDAPVLDDGDQRHLVAALRVRDGDPLTISDGRGSWCPATLRDGSVQATGDVALVDAPDPTLTVAFAPVKGDRPEWAVQKLVELGVDRIVPVMAARSVVRWEGDRAHRHVERMTRIAREAAMQCKRAHMAVVEPVTAVGDLLSAGNVVLAVPGGPPPTAATTAVAVGPEGGWTDDEVARAEATVGLGAHVLRTETAAVAAGTLLTALRAGLVHPTTPTRTGEIPAT